MFRKYCRKGFSFVRGRYGGFGISELLLCNLLKPVRSVVPVDFKKASPQRKRITPMTHRLHKSGAFISPEFISMRRKSFDNIHFFHSISSDCFGKNFRAFGQQVTIALTVGNFLDRTQDSLFASTLHSDSIGIFFCDDFMMVKFHEKADSSRGLSTVHSELVNHESGFQKRIHVQVPYSPCKSAERFARGEPLADSRFGEKVHAAVGTAETPHVFYLIFFNIIGTAVPL